MKNRLSKQNGLSRIATLLVLLVSPVAVFSQGGAQPAPQLSIDQFAGNYKGIAKAAAGDISLSLEIKSDKGKISGRLVTPQAEYPITSGEIVEGKLVLKLGTADSGGTLTLQQREGILVGEGRDGVRVSAVEFKKEPSAAELLSGEWDAAADAQGQPFLFTLTLKVEGEKVTGGTISQLGQSTITSGSWKDGKLVFVLSGENGGQIGMMANLQDGKLIGDFDFSGQMTGKWAATKKKP